MGIRYKKTQILCIFFMGISFLAEGSKAVTNESLYVACKSWADKNFNPDRATVSDIECIAYVVGILDTSDYLCDLGKVTNDIALKAQATHNAKLQVNAIIQSYVNDMSANPEAWKYTAGPRVLNVAKDLTPCVSTN